MVAGLSGQSWIGPSLSGGGLYFGRSCVGDPSGCDRGGSRIVRYDLVRHWFTRAPGPRRLYGLAVTAAHTYELAEPAPDRGCSLFYVPPAQRPQGQGPCTLVDAGVLMFTKNRDGRSA